MALRVEFKAKLLISQDNLANPQQVAFNSGEVSSVDTTTYEESSSSTLKIAPATTDQQINLDSIAQAGLLYLCAKATGVKVKIVPVGSVLGDVPALELLPNVPMLLGAKIAAVYVSNPDTLNPAIVIVGAAGN
jgi:hypothetical protein